jgi:hypothetical protein
MTIRIIGEHPFARDENNRLRSRIGTIFPRTRTLVTLPGIHATQRMAYTQALNTERQHSGLPRLSEEEEMAEWQQSVDLIMDETLVLIRPDPENMPLAFEADDLLQELVSKQTIKFLNVMNERVRGAIKERGENWRIAPLPRSPEEMKRMIQSSNISIGGRSIYYYSRLGGTRYLTYQQFCDLGALPDNELGAHLREIHDFSGRTNRLGQPEVAFFVANRSFGSASFAAIIDASVPGDILRQRYEELKTKFRDAVRPDLHDDNPDYTEWRNRMFSALIGQGDVDFSEEAILGIGSEFYMQIEWLPGGRIEEGELVIDSIFDELERVPVSPELRSLCDEKSRGFIFNFVREFGDIEHVNVGRVIGSLSKRPHAAGRRDVYVAEVKQRTEPKALVRILRMQKWGIREHLEDGADLLWSIIQAEEYTEYILDRRLGCRQLGMNLPSRITTRKISERYHGARAEYEGQMIWSTYYERDYIQGMATDKIPRSRFQNALYGQRFAELLGRAAAPNIVAGRMNLQTQVLFDDGDEILIEGANGLPEEIIVSDHTGTFVDYTSDLERHAEAYASPINRRLPFLPYPRDVAAAYLASFTGRFSLIQQEYRKRKRSFDTLFKQRLRDERGSFAFRWEKVLERLNRTNPADLADCIRRHIQIP